ncbi:MAG: hypothetical protein OXH52_22495 [Gammaproteobacteria bacterium]|nr:hypothetical protein [Gammaproteobacteria bacterium]
MSLTARHLEAAGMATVILGSALDVVEHCGVPRFLFTDFPLGNPCGKPFDASMQEAIVVQGIDLLEDADHPRTTARTPFRWSDDESWRDRYMEVRSEDMAQLARRGEARRARRVREKAEGRARVD